MKLSYYISACDKNDELFHLTWGFDELDTTIKYCQSHEKNWKNDWSIYEFDRETGNFKLACTKDSIELVKLARKIKESK